MRPSLVIAKRDIVSLLKGPMIWSLIGFCSLLWSASFVRIVFTFIEKQASLGGQNLHMTVMLTHVSWVNVILLFCVPLLTMRSIAEERKNYTFQLLQSLPLRSVDIVIGKLLCGFFSVSLLIAISYVYPLILSISTKIDSSLLASAYIGLLLMGFLYVSLGVLSSSLTDSVVVSGALAIVLNLALFVLSGLGGTVNNSEFSKFLNHLDVTGHFWTYLTGVLSLESTVFYLSSVIFLAFLAERVLESQRWR